MGLRESDGVGRDVDTISARPWSRVRWPRARCRAEGAVEYRIDGAARSVEDGVVGVAAHRGGTDAGHHHVPRCAVRSHLVVFDHHDRVGQLDQPLHPVAEDKIPRLLRRAGTVPRPEGFGSSLTVPSSIPVPRIPSVPGGGGDGAAGRDASRAPSGSGRPASAGPTRVAWLARGRPGSPSAR